MDYYSLFWGPEVISTIDEPDGALTCHSTTLAVLAESGPFRDLLLTVLRSRSDFGPYRGLLLTVLGSRSNFHD